MAMQSNGSPIDLCMLLPPTLGVRFAIGGFAGTYLDRLAPSRLMSGSDEIAEPIIALGNHSPETAKPLGAPLSVETPSRLNGSLIDV